MKTIVIRGAADFEILAHRPDEVPKAEDVASDVQEVVNLLEESLPFHTFALLQAAMAKKLAENPFPFR